MTIMPDLTVADLVSFEQEIAELFNNGKIRAPVHLYSGNEKEMINVFSDITDEDWVFCSWRSHYQCLLKGVPREAVRASILEGRSISLCFPEQRIYSSAIVGGTIPIAVGAAMALKRGNLDGRVHCFMGDMTSETGIAWEAIKYSRAHRLPIRFIIEDNGKSVCSDTREVWNLKQLTFENSEEPMVVFYKYTTSYPHAGAGKRIQF